MSAALLTQYVDQYIKAGWHPIPLPPRSKSMPPTGTTGRAGKDLTLEELRDLLRDNSNVGIRMPDNVIGIDVDAYAGKTGQTTMEWLEYGPPGEEDAALGWLPNTFVLTSRDDKVSGIHFYRVPPGRLWEGQAGLHVEIIQRAHRYAVAAPSMHPEGREYKWVHPSGVPCGVPLVSDLTELPEKWVEHLTKKRTHSPSTYVGPAADREEMSKTVNSFAPGPPCSCVEKTGDRAFRAAQREFGSAHDNLLPAVLTLVRQGTGGCKGAKEALITALEEYKKLEPGRDHDFFRMVAGAIPMAREDPWACADKAVAALTEWTAAPPAPAVVPATGAVPAEAEAEPDLNTYGYVTFDKDFWHPKDPVWFIPQVALEGQVASIYSAGGLGKSLLLQDVVLGLTHRGRVFGEPVDRQPVLYLDRENSMYGLSKRLISMGFIDTEIPLLHYSLLGQWPPLDSVRGGMALLREVQRTGAKFVVIDTLSKVVEGDENDNDTWNGLHSHTMVYLKRAGITVMQLDHTGKDEDRGQRGGSSKQNNADVVWHLKWSGSYVSLVNKKDRDGLYKKKLTLERQTVPVLEHRFLTEIAEAATRHIQHVDKVSDIREMLDGLNVPLEFGRDRARKLLKQAYPDIVLSNHDIDQAIKDRRSTDDD